MAASGYALKGTKLCGKCLGIFPREDFYPRNAKYPGKWFSAWCKECAKSYGYSCRTAEKKIEIAKKQSEKRGTIEGAAKLLLTSAKSRAKKKGFDFDLDEYFILEKLRLGKCERTSIPFILKKGYGEKHPFSPTLDRVNNRWGYTKDNVVLVCNCYNLAKSIWTHEIVVEMAWGLLKTVRNT